MLKKRKGGGWEERDKKIWEALKKWTKTEDEGDREELKCEKKRLGETRKEKKEKEKVKKKEKLENSESMTEF